MSKDLELSLKLQVDKKEGESNLSAFRRAFKGAMEDIGKSSAEVDEFGQLVSDIKLGKKAVDELDKETRQLYDTYNKGAQLAADKDILGLKAHADIQREIDETREAYKRLKTSGTLTQEELAQAALKTEERIRHLKHETNGWSDALQDAGGSIAGLAASAAGLATMAGYAIDFESAMADVRKVVDGTDEQFDALTDRIKELTGELPITAEGLAAIAAQGGQLGVPIEKLDQFVTLAAKMGTAFELSVEQAGNAVAKLSNIFNIPIENVEELGDVINVLGNTTAAREADILDVLTRIGGTASQFKLTADQAAVLAATMIEMGAKAEVAGTGINALLSKLQTANVQGNDFKLALETMGLSAEQLAENIRNNPQQALNEFLATLAKLDDQARPEVLTRLFGQEYQDDIARLLNGLDNYEASLNRVTDAGNTAGAMSKEFAARMETTEAQIQLMQNGLQEAAINLGSVFLPAIRAAAVGIGDVARALAEFTEANPAIAAIATSLGTVAVSAGALRLLFLSLGVVGSKAFGNIRKEIALANRDLLTLKASSITVGAAIKSAGALAAAGWIGWDIGKQLHEEFEVARLAGVRLAQTFTLVMEAAGAAYQALTNPSDLGQIWDDFTASIKRVNETYQQMYEEVDAGLDVQRKAAAAAKNTAIEFQNTGDTAAVAAQKIRDEFAALDLTNAAGIQKFTQQIDSASDSASLLTEELKKWISETSAADLTKFQEGLVEAFTDGKLSAEKLAEYNELVLRQSFETLGLSAEAALGKISPAAQDAITQVDLIRDTMISMGETGEARMVALEQAIRGAVGKADTAAAVSALRDRVAELGESGELSADQVKRLNGELKDQVNALNQIKPGIDSVEDAMRSLGLTSQVELQKTATQALATVNALREMKAPLADQKAAFIAYAEAALAANEHATLAQQQILNTQLQVKAATLGLTTEVNQLINAQIESGNAGEKAGEKTSQAARQAADSTRDLSEATKETARDAQAVAASLADWFGAVRNEMSGLSEQARVLFDDKLGLASSGTLNEVDALKASLAAAREELGKIAIDNLQTFDATGINKWKNSVLKAKDETIIAYQEQKLKFLEYTNAIESGSRLNEGFINQAQSALQTMDLLGNEDLSQLQSAIDSATRKLESMTDAAKNTLSGLQDELDRLQGNQDAIDQREYEEKRQELAQALEEARKWGNDQAIKYYSDALKTLEDVRRERQQQSRESSSSNNSSSSSGAQPAQSSGSTHNVNITLGNKQTTASFDSASDKATFMEMLEEFKNRSGG